MGKQSLGCWIYPQQINNRYPLKGGNLQPASLLEFKHTFADKDKGQVVEKGSSNGKEGTHGNLHRCRPHQPEEPRQNNQGEEEATDQGSGLPRCSQGQRLIEEHCLRPFSIDRKKGSKAEGIEAALRDRLVDLVVDVLLPAIRLPLGDQPVTHIEKDSSGQ